MRDTGRGRLLLVFGSQTGQAQAIAEQIYERFGRELDLADNNIDLLNCSLDLTEKRFCIEQEKTVVFVVSTTGEGEAPENALKFWRRIRKKTLPPNHLESLSYALLGLGDSNYNRFASFGQDLDRRLIALGAKRFYSTGFGDDAVGLEVGVEPWIEGLLLVIPKVFGILTVHSIPKTVIDTMSASSAPPSLTVASSPLCEETELSLPQISSKMSSLNVEFLEEVEGLEALESPTDDFFFQKLPVMESNLFDARVTQIKSLTKIYHNSGDTERKVVLEVEVEASADCFPSYVAGDSFGFISGNSDEEVLELLACLGLDEKINSICSVDGKGLPHLPKIIALKQLLKFYLELRSVPKKSCLRHFGEFCSDAAQKRRLFELSSREGSDDYAKYVRNAEVGILDILKSFNFCKPSLEALLVNVPCFLPRYYSVVNSPSPDKKNAFKVAFTVVQLAAICGRKGTQLNGVFTGLLHRQFIEKLGQSPEDALACLSLDGKNLLSIKCFKRKNAHFKLPPFASVPLILVGPGTGVAPFLGFLEQRQREKAEQQVLRETWLFFGCRHSQEDFIYEQQLKKMVEEKVLSNLCVSFSREETGEYPDAKYVQDIIVKKSSQLYDMIVKREAFVYVCGDMKMMSVSVSNAFIKILKDEGNMIHESAVKYVREMQASKRYLQDVWA